MSNSEKAERLHADLQQRLQALVSGQQWQQALAFAARFHRYSFGNTMLIAMQCPQATYVAGFRRWHQLGRQVRKGERGIAILAPITRFRESTDEEPTEESTRKVVLCGFRVVYVFDISQTDGESVPDVMRPQLLIGEGPGWQGLAELVEADGFEVQRGDCGGANGFTDHLNRIVRVRSDVSLIQATKTLAHELAHVRLHTGNEYAMGCRGLIEVEAESVAFIVCAALGIDSAEYSLAYVAHWSAGKPEIVAATGEKVIRCASSILDAMPPASSKPVHARRSPART